jgi:hypothetical protein
VVQNNTKTQAVITAYSFRKAASSFCLEKQLLRFEKQ